MKNARLWLVAICCLIIVAWLLLHYSVGPKVYHWAGRDSGKIKDIAQVLAWVAAALYFGYQAISGYFLVNVSLSVDTERRKSHNEDKDFLKVTVSVEKGDRGTLHLYDAKLRIRQNGEWHKPIDIEVVRFGHIQENGLTINFGKTVKDRSLNITPGEKAIFAEWTEVDSDSPCLVEAHIMGTRISSFYVAQWKTSAVSLPITDNKEPKGKE